MRIISLNELSVELDNFLLEVDKNYTLDRQKWQLMSQTGCRVRESLETNRWTALSDSFRLQPQKNNNTRDIAFKDLTQDVIGYLLAGNQNPATNNYNKYVHQFHTEFSYKKFFIGNKGVSTHLFRHRIVKIKKQVEGWTDNQIRVWLGEKTQKAANSYIYSDIYVNF